MSEPDENGFHPSVRSILQFFTYAHLPEQLQKVSLEFHCLAWNMARTLPQNPELTAGLRKLLEAKDCAVRAMIAKG